MRIAWVDARLLKAWHVEALRRYDSIEITGNSNRDMGMITTLRSRLKELIAADNIKNGVMVTFANKSNYAEFIDVLDICYLNDDKGVFFVPCGNKLYIGHTRPKPASLQTGGGFRS